MPPSGPLRRSVLAKIQFTRHPISAYLAREPVAQPSAAGPTGQPPHGHQDIGAEDQSRAGPADDLDGDIDCAQAAAPRARLRST